MLKQPDIHYLGELTEEYVNDLTGRINVALVEIESLSINDKDWNRCKNSWIESLKYAGLRCVAIGIKAKYGMTAHREDEDRKCIDITLSILRDLEEAKLKNFLREES